MADGATSEPGSEEPAPAPVWVVPSLSLSSPPPLPLPPSPLNRQPAAAETLSPPHGSKALDRNWSLDNTGGGSEVATDDAEAPTPPPPKRRRRKRRTRAKIATAPTVPRYQLKLPPGLLTSSSSSSTSSSSSSSPASASSERKEHLNGADHERVKQTDMEKKKGKGTKKGKDKKKKKDTKKDKEKKKKKKDKRKKKKKKKDKKKKGSDDDEAPVCRVCRMEASAEAGELYAPCLCAGSMQFVHQACLTRWLQVTHRDYCELCKHRFAFEAVYAEDAPRVLGPIEFAGGVVRESASALGLGFRLLLVGLAWLLVFPLGTFRFLVLVAGSDPVGMFVDLDPLTVLRDATFGAAICLVIFGAFMGLMLLRDFIVFNNVHPIDPPQVLPGANEGEEDLVIEGLGGAAPNAVEEVFFGIFDNRDEFEDDWVDDVAAQLAADDLVPDPPLDGLEEGAVPDADDDDHDDGNENGHDDGNAGDADEDNVIDNNDGGGNAAPPFEVVVGLEGPLGGFFVNIFYIFLFIIMVVFAVIGVPVLLGRLAVVGASLAGVDLLGSDLDGTSVLASLPNATASNATAATNGTIVNATADAAATVDLDGQADKDVDSVLPSFAVPMAAAARTGYLVTALLFGAALAYWRVFRPAADSAADLTRRSLLFLVVFAKVAALTVAELGLFPWVVGWLFDLATLRLFHSTFASRRATALALPIMSHGIHWVVGICVLLYFASFIALIRSFTRREVLWYLRDPADPDFSPMREFLEYSLARHVRRFVLSVALNAFVLCLAIYLPIRLVEVLNPAAVPLATRRGTGALPADLIIFHVFFPIALDKIRLASRVRAVTGFLLARFARLLDLRHYLLPNEDGDDDAAAAVAHQQHEAVAVAMLHGGEENNGDAGDNADDNFDGDGDDLPPNQAYGDNVLGTELRVDNVAGLLAAGNKTGAVGNGVVFGERSPVGQHFATPWVGADRVPDGEDDTPPPAGQQSARFAYASAPSCVEDERALPCFRLRVAVLYGLVFAAVGLCVATVLGVAMPFGTFALHAVGIEVSSPVYGLCVGFYALCALLVGIHTVAEYAASARIPALASVGLRWAVALLKCAVVALVWAATVPLLLCLLFELVVVVPMLVRSDQSVDLVAALGRDWLWGCLATSAGVRLVLLGGDSKLKARLDAVQARGVLGMEVAATVMGIIVPIAVMLLAAICVPYVLTRGLLPLCGVPDWASEHLFRFSYPSLVIGGVAWVAVGIVQHRLAEIHNRIRDEKYMIGTTLANAPPHVAAAGGAQGPDADHASEANEPDVGNDAGAGVAPPLAGAATS